MIKSIYRTLTVFSAIAILATVGGVEQDMFSISSGLIRVTIFMILTYLFGKAGLER